MLIWVQGDIDGITVIVGIEQFILMVQQSHRAHNEIIHYIYVLQIWHEIVTHGTEHIGWIKRIR